MLAYLRYFGTHILIFATAAGLLAGGGWYWSGLIAGFLIWVGGDALSPMVAATREYKYPFILDFALYTLFPSLIIMVVAFAWALSPEDLFGIGSWVNGWSSYDIIAAKLSSTVWHYLGACLSFGLAMAMGGILTAHELGHRTDDRMAMWTARWMLAMAFNSTLEVAHVFGHHREVGTPLDPATARRGENIYHFFVRSTVGQFFQAWRIEKKRLRAVRGVRFVLQNKVVWGVARSGFVAGLFILVGGWFALAGFLFASMWNKFLLESLNYVKHYGFVQGYSICRGMLITTNE